MTTLHLAVRVLLLSILFASFAYAAEPRATVFISDLHMGVGKDSTGRWDPSEDFRWSEALAGFLDEISQWGKEGVDLVIVGDFLELWQPRKPCASSDPDLGCTIEEMKDIALTVIMAHKADLARLGTFANKGENRLYIIPGNHDAALLLPDIWQQVAQAINVADNARLNLVKQGIWSSDDGVMVAEHGHQIGTEVNAFKDWPQVTKTQDGSVYLVRPWGEQFVQQIFNAREREYPIIDNLSPETAAIRYYMADKGFGGKVADAVQFIKFNLLETSLSQVGTFLGPPAQKPQIKPDWDMTHARNLGYQLFVNALNSEDPYRIKLLSAKGSEWSEIRQELTALAKDIHALPDDEVRLLCDQIAIRAAQPNGKKISTCDPSHLGSLFEQTFIPRERIMRTHLEGRIREFPNMKIFIYGHTHVLEYDWDLKLFNGLRTTKIFNTGAFQRIIDDESFLAEAKKQGLSPSQALQTMRLEELPPCFSCVLVKQNQGKTEIQLKNWHIDHTGKGAFRDPCDSSCAKMSKKCQ